MKSVSFVKKIEIISDADIPYWHKEILDIRLDNNKENYIELNTFKNK